MDEDPKLGLHRFAFAFTTMVRIAETCLLFLLFLALLLAACSLRFPEILTARFWADLLQ
jgi:hypothetical protein